MLELLTRYAEQKGLVAEPGFAPKLVRWSISCSPDGRVSGVLELGDTEDKRNRGHTFPCCPDLSQPELKRGGAGCRHFLVDTAAVVALLDDAPDDKLRAKHRYFVGLLRRAAAVMPELGTVADCLEDPANIEAICTRLRSGKARPTDNVTFSVGGSYPVESDAWHDWWREFRTTFGARKPAARGEAAAARMRCLASGELVEPVLTHPKIKGLADVGGLSAGDALASFKQAAFRSYGLVQSANAAVSEEVAARYRAALNHLIAEHGEPLGRKTKVVHWYKDSVRAEDDPLGFLTATVSEEELERSAQKQARELLRSIRSGERRDLHDNYYYALTLSGAGGRVMVRDWMEGRFEELVAAIAAWFDDLAIVRRDGRGLAPAPKLMAVLGGLVRALDDLAAPTVAKMWRVAACGERFPYQMLAQAFARVRKAVIGDEPIRHASIGLIKAFHIREGDEYMKTHLNEEHPSPAYQCGRLMAVLAALQYSALGDVGAGVIQRYYAAACATPALVLGRLIRNSQFHLEKLETPLRIWYRNRIADVMGRISDLPSALGLRDQSLFALGYYQQIAGDRAGSKKDAQ